MWAVFLWVESASKSESGVWIRVGVQVMSEIYVFCLAAISLCVCACVCKCIEGVCVCDNKTKQNLRLDGSYDWKEEEEKKEAGRTHRINISSRLHVANVANIECQIFWRISMGSTHTQKHTYTLIQWSLWPQTSKELKLASPKLGSYLPHCNLYLWVAFASVLLLLVVVVSA